MSRLASQFKGALDWKTPLHHHHHVTYIIKLAPPNDELTTTTTEVACGVGVEIKKARSHQENCICTHLSAMISMECPTVIQYL